VMRLSSLLQLGAACMLVAASGSIAAPREPDLPATIRKDIEGLERSCREAGGQPTDSPGALLVADLTGDGLVDYAIDQGGFVCRGAASIFSGSGGSEVTVYVSTSGSDAVRVFSQGSHGLKLDKGVRPARLYLQVAGVLCGQRDALKVARAEQVFCWRPLSWSQQTQRMDFLPVSQALRLK
jgi:hypothetical protein